MIEVAQLSKRFGAVHALDDVGFSVNKGEVVGLLGPNGAGKTTTMRILCGCIGASKGSVRIGGESITEQPERVKRRVGYLPENPPLYAQMEVAEYLRFTATIRGVADPNAATARVLEQVGLTASVGGRPPAERIIGHLSKGYQQRVGLAQALIHEPDVLVLDEPASGLDPAQRKEIRQLLQGLAKDASRTIILSSHVLAEVEAICSRVIVIHQGRIVAEDSISNLGRGVGVIHITLAKPGEAAHAALAAVPGVRQVEEGADGRYALQVEEDVRAAVAQAAVAHGLLSLTQDEGLENIYLRLTGAEA